MFDKQQNNIAPAGGLENDSGDIWKRSNNAIKAAETAPQTESEANESEANESGATETGANETGANETGANETGANETETSDGSAEQPAPPTATEAGAPSDRIDRVMRYAAAGQSAQEDDPGAAAPATPEPPLQTAPVAAPEQPAPPKPEENPVAEPMAPAETAAPEAETIARPAEDPGPTAVELGPDSAGSETTAPGQTLTVGRGIRLVAKACECDGLAVEGHLEATAQAKTLVVSKGGSFIGSAEVATAEIHGTFEGNLTATERLTIHPSGSVSGTTRYQEIIIEAGGQISGSTQCLGASPKTGAGANGS